MPEKKRQYPIRSDISQQGPARALPARRERSVAQTFLPMASSIYGTAMQDAADAYNQGKTAEALGAATAGTIAAPVGAAADIVGRPIANLALGAKDFFAGYAGLKGGSGSAGTVYHPITGEPRPEGIDYSPAKPRITAEQLDAMQPQNTIVDQYINVNPRDRYNARIDAILGSGQPLSIRQLQALNPLLPSEAKPPSAEDQVLGLAVQAIENRYANQQAEAAKLEEAGDTEAADALRRSSAQNRLRYIAGLSQSGFIPFETAVNGK